MNEALEFYKLKPNYTKDDLKGVRNKFIKETTDIEALKKGTSYYNILIENILDPEFILLEEIFDFERSLVYLTKPNIKYNDLTEKYIIKVQYVKTVEELKALEDEYYKELSLLNAPKKEKRESKKAKLDSNIKKVHELVDRYQKDLDRINNLTNEIKSINKDKTNSKEIKNSLKKMLKEKLNLVNTEAARDLYKQVCFRIDATSDDEITKIIPIVNRFEFNDIDTELTYLNEFEPLIYINKFNGDIISLINKDNNKSRFYSLKHHRYYDILNDRFQVNFTSLKSFLRKSEYIGNKNISLLSNDSKVNIKFPNQDLIYYKDNIVLSYDNNSNDFYFYPSTNFKLPNASWLIGDIKKKSNNSFQDTTYTYKMIIDNVKYRLNKEILNTEIKRR